MTHTAAGLINSHVHHGPDIPMDAKIIARLPLTVMRRILPAPPPELAAIEALNERWPPAPEQQWVLYEWTTSTVGEFWLVEKQDDPADCDVCGGAGEFLMGSNWYDCQECEDNQGPYIEGLPLVARFVRQDGTILINHPITGC